MSVFVPAITEGGHWNANDARPARVRVLMDWIRAQLWLRTISDQMIAITAAPTSQKHTRPPPFCCSSHCSGRCPATAADADDDDDARSPTFLFLTISFFLAAAAAIYTFLESWRNLVASSAASLGVAWDEGAPPPGTRSEKRPRACPLQTLHAKCALQRRSLFLCESFTSFSASDVLRFVMRGFYFSLGKR